MDAKTLTSRLESCRASQEEVAALTGISQPYLCLIEGGRRGVSDDVAGQIGRALDAAEAERERRRANAYEIAARVESRPHIADAYAASPLQLREGMDR